MTYFSLPWDQSTYLGYFGEMCFFSTIGAAFLFANALILSLFLLFCIHFRAFLEIFKDMIANSNHRKDENRRNDDDGRKSIVDLIRFHLLIKE